MHGGVPRAYRLGLDLGSNSIGWFMVMLDTTESRRKPVSLGPGGVRVFPDRRDRHSGSSNAVDRRAARGMRRRRDRLLARQKALIAALTEHGLMPTEENQRKALEALDPYELRSAALNEPLPLHHLGRAIFHLAQRRGFLSNRKAERKDDEKGAIKEAAAKLRKEMEKVSARTLGEYLWARHRQRKSVRARNIATGSKADYEFYPTRALIEAEFNAIWEAQAAHHPMNREARDAIHRTIFFQRPLKQPPVGKCSLDPATQPFELDPEGYRVSWAHPLAQRFRILQEVRNLDVGETGGPRRRLTKEEGDTIALALLQNDKVSFDKMRVLLKLPAEARFNLESERRTELKGDETAERLAHRSRFSKAWRNFSLDRQCTIVERLLAGADEEALVDWLQTECKIERAVAEEITDAPLPESHCRLGLRAIRKLLPHMDAGLNYPDAAKAAGFDHSKQPTGEMLGRLPYYGRWLPDAVLGSGDPRDLKEAQFGRFPNPTVHIGLGQLRRIVNDLIDDWGEPTEIVIEFTRSLKLSPDEKKDLLREQRQNQAKNAERIAKLRETLGQAEFDPSPRDLLKVRLWEELNPRDPLDRKCPFTGETIGLKRLMSHEVEIEHLIPYQLGLDDSPANKTVCLAEANRAKGRLTPFQAFSSSPTIAGIHYDWEAIIQRATALPRNKRWRFDPDAHEKYKEMGGFLGRQLNETGWLARVAKQYLSAVCDPNAIWVVPGRLTATLRRQWGLNSLLPDHNYGGVQERDETFRAATDELEFSGVKNRTDHRHHSIDALVVAMTDRSLLQRMASSYDDRRDKIDVQEPWQGFRDQVKSRLNQMTVSYKPDHGRQGKLHEDTAYGLVKEPEKEGANLVRRKDLVALTENEIDMIRDRRLRDMVRGHVTKAREAGVDLASALRSFRDNVRDPHIANGLRRVRLLKVEDSEYLVPIANRSDGTVYKTYSAGENFCVEMYEMPDGRWRGEAIRRFDANQSSYQPRWRKLHPDASFVMRVHKGDLLSLDHDGKRQVMVVHRLDAAAGRFKLAAHNETGKLDRRHAAANDIDPFRWLMASYGTLKKAGAERVRVDPLGRIWRVR